MKSSQKLHVFKNLLLSPRLHHLVKNPSKGPEVRAADTSQITCCILQHLFLAHVDIVLGGTTKVFDLGQLQVLNVQEVHVTMTVENSTNSDCLLQATLILFVGLWNRLTSKTQK
jgi:hypothetical protein